jgi:hypothetical protein
MNSNGTVRIVLNIKETVRTSAEIKSCPERNSFREVIQQVKGYGIKMQIDNLPLIVRKCKKVSNIYCFHLRLLVHKLNDNIHRLYLTAKIFVIPACPESFLKKDSRLSAFDGLRE